jgi:solute carrier family 25 carnitine/acylcarnitine transporter 20/29
MDVFIQTVRKEGALGLYKGNTYYACPTWCLTFFRFPGMLSPLLGIAGVNSLLFASYGLAKRVVTPFGELSLPQTALAGAIAGAANAVLASPG